MAQVLLLSATRPDDTNPEHRTLLRDFERLAPLDRFGVHSVTTDPEAADVILFLESYGAGWHFEGVRRHAFTKRYREKCFIFCVNPYVIPFLPGLYTGIDRRWASARTVGGFYPEAGRSRYTTYSPARADSRYLYSFVGAVVNAEVRRRLASLTHPRSFFKDTSADFAKVLRHAMPPEEGESYLRDYAEVSRASKFVLCPRGVSASSIRLFETMRMGRAPVILSDAWVEPPGPDWRAFAIQIPEKQAADLPRILEEREEEAVERGELARAAWAEWYANEVAFHRTVEACLALRNGRRLPEALARWPTYLQYLRPFHARRALRSALRFSPRAS